MAGLVGEYHHITDNEVRGIYKDQQSREDKVVREPLSSWMGRQVTRAGEWLWNHKVEIVAVLAIAAACALFIPGAAAVGAGAFLAESIGFEAAIVATVLTPAWTMKLFGDLVDRLRGTGAHEPAADAAVKDEELAESVAAATPRLPSFDEGETHSERAQRWVVGRASALGSLVVEGAGLALQLVKVAFRTVASVVTLGTSVKPKDLALDLLRTVGLVQRVVNSTAQLIWPRQGYTPLFGKDAAGRERASVLARVGNTVSSGILPGQTNTYLEQNAGTQTLKAVARQVFRLPEMFR